MIKRNLQQQLIELLHNHSAVGLLGPRQVGKTTLAYSLSQYFDCIYLDLESPKDLAKLADPEIYFIANKNKLIIIDEVQRKPDLFQVIRVDIDRARREGHKFGRFLLLGSASVDLLKQSSESLAGRIYYKELSPLMLNEVYNHNSDLFVLLSRGGYPESYLAVDDKASFDWRKAFITTYLERDIPMLGPRIPAETLRRFWIMLAHSNSQLVNGANLAASLGLSGTTISRYLDLLVDVLMVRKLEPWFVNAKKRLVRSPKVYIRDTGILHALLNISNMEDLSSNPIIGSSWEGFVIENIISSINPNEYYFYRTSAGAEIDLILRINNKLWAIEIKYSLSPKISKGFYIACEDVQPDNKIIIYPGEETYMLKDNIIVMPLLELIKRFETN